MTKTMSVQQSKTELRLVLNNLHNELKQDIKFFGSCGFIVGALMILHSWLKNIGVNPKETLADALLTDLISFNVFGFVSFGLIGLGALASCLRAMNLTWMALETLVSHLELRLTQISSTIIAFNIGLLVFAAGYAICTKTLGGVELCLAATLFNAAIYAGFVFSTIIGRRIPPFNECRIALIIFIGAIICLGLIVVYGPN